MDIRFNGKVAIVTGGGSGIGAATARRFAEQGASVVIADVNPKGGELSEQLQSEGYSCAYIRTNVRSNEETQQMVSFAESTYGGVDILVNCAGIFPRAMMLDTTDELWDSIMDINLKGTFRCCKAAVPALIRRGAGVIINIGSLSINSGGPDMFAYATSKGGIWTLTRNLANSLAKHKIRVNCISPGWVASEGEIELQRSLGLPDDWSETMGHRLPLGRVQVPDDIARTIVFIASDLADQITGQNLAVDGGLGLGLR